MTRPERALKFLDDMCTQTTCTVRVVSGHRFVVPQQAREGQNYWPESTRVIRAYDYSNNEALNIVFDDVVEIFAEGPRRRWLKGFEVIK